MLTYVKKTIYVALFLLYLKLLFLIFFLRNNPLWKKMLIEHVMK